MILRANNLNSKCQICKRPRYQHSVIYYHNNVYVKVSCEISGISEYQTFNIEEQLIRQNEYGNNIVDSKKSIIKDLSPFQRNVSNLQHLRKATFTSFTKSEIRVYLECNICGAILTQEKQVSSIYLEYSFTRYLLHLFLNNIPREENENEASRKEFEETHKNCKHPYRNRVFNHNGTLIKISSGLCNFYEYENLKSVIDRNKNELENIKANLILLKKEEFKNKLKIFSGEIVKILENSSDSVKTQVQATADKKSLQQTMPISQTSLIEDWKSAIEFGTLKTKNSETENLDMSDEDEIEEYYDFFNNPQTNGNFLENSQELNNLDETGSFKDKPDPIEENPEESVKFEDFQYIQEALADKIVQDRKNTYKSFKKEFIISQPYYELINKAKVNLAPFLDLIRTKIEDLMNNLSNYFNNKTIKSYLEIEYLRVRFMKKICMLLNLIQFLSSKRKKKKLEKLDEKQRIYNTMKSSMQITQEDQDYDSSDDEKQYSDEEKNKELNDPPSNFNNILEGNEVKELNFTVLFRSMFIDMMKGQAFTDMKDAKDFYKMQKYVKKKFIYI